MLKQGTKCRKKNLEYEKDTDDICPGRYLPDAWNGRGGHTNEFNKLNTSSFFDITNQSLARKNIWWFRRKYPRGKKNKA